jgi:hypothetical protein
MKNMFSFLLPKKSNESNALSNSTDFKTILEKFLITFETNCTDMVNARTANDVVSTLDKATAKMKEIVPKMNELTKKYPEIKDLQKGARLPNIFNEFEVRFALLGRKRIQAVGHAGVYFKDPKVEKSLEKFIEIMNEIINYQEISFLDYK